jgi:crotonobetainyl-CoA:carnitine CoA-transferase CaiB-like acyl-CoA transferase
LPFEGLRILDFTAYWAGPIITHFFAMMGADVIHIESVKRPDGLRAATLKFDMSDGWWEAGPFYASTNTNKRDLTLDMSSEIGRDLARRLMALSDVVVENYSPRVFEEWGLGWEQVCQINPSLVMVRAPGYGLSGPWRDRVAYATTIEQACGAAWVTGFPDDRPDCTSGAMDPLAGSHAVYATLMALDHRRRTGQGTLVEVPQFTSGFNLLAELVVEYTGTGRILGRVGNRSWSLAPQGTYRCADAERDMPGVPADDWVSVSVENDSQWVALCGVIGADALAASPELTGVEGRHTNHDRIDAAIEAWTKSRPAHEAAEVFCAAGVPAAPVAEAHHLDRLPQVKARELYEIVEHTVLPTLPIVGYPAQFEAGPRRVHRRRSPLFGEHNREILEGLLGLAPEEVDALERDGVIGNQAPTATAW